LEFIVALLIVIGIVWWLFSQNKKMAQAAPQQAAPQQVAPRTHYKDYRDELEKRPIEELDEDEQIIRRAGDAFVAERETRQAEYRAKKAALAADKTKIAKAADFIKTSRLNLALPFVQEATQHWPSWSKMDASRWTAPMPLSDMDVSATGGFDHRWVQFRPDGGQLYKINFEKSRMPLDDDMEYASITLFVDNEDVLGMFVKRNWTKEWDRWAFEAVESLKVGPWIEGFMAFYNRLRSIEENKSEDRSNKYVSELAAKIDLGGAG
jgi:hypothetical protein